jgi:hypothetical protein
MVFLPQLLTAVLLQFKSDTIHASAIVIIRFYQYRKLALLQKTWFDKKRGRSRGHSTLPLNMHELRASRISYKRSLANLKLVLQARRFESRECLR